MPSADVSLCVSYRNFEMRWAYLTLSRINIIRMVT